VEYSFYINDTRHAGSVLMHVEGSHAMALAIMDGKAAPSQARVTGKYPSMLSPKALGGYWNQ
jgi:hypothetical protein